MSLPETLLEAPPERPERALILAPRPYMGEDRAASWRHTLVAFSLLAATIAAIVLMGSTWVRALLSVFAGLLVVRCLLLFHDYMHGSLLRGSRFASALYPLFGILTLNPPLIQRETHH